MPLARGVADYREQLEMRNGLEMAVPVHTRQVFIPAMSTLRSAVIDRPVSRILSSSGPDTDRTAEVEMKSAERRVSVNVARTGSVTTQ
jgi:hypothetical protein